MFQPSQDEQTLYQSITSLRSQSVTSKIKYPLPKIILETIDTNHFRLYYNNQEMGFLLSKVIGLEKVTRFFFYVHNVV